MAEQEIIKLLDNIFDTGNPLDEENYLQITLEPNQTNYDPGKP